METETTSLGWMIIAELESHLEKEEQAIPSTKLHCGLSQEDAAGLHKSILTKLHKKVLYWARQICSQTL